MAYSFDNLVAFYPDGAWWLPCVLEGGDGLLEIADSLGIDDSFCPVRAMLGAFVGQNRFPIPGLLTCSVGATCDDFSAIAQRLESLGFPILWWEIRTAAARPRRSGRRAARRLPAPAESGGVREIGTGARAAGAGNVCRAAAGRRAACGGHRPGQPGARSLAELRRLVFTGRPCPLPALEMLIAEMLAIHFCSDHNETLGVLAELLEEVRRRVRCRRRACCRPMPCAYSG